MLLMRRTDGLLADVRERVLARDGHRCVVAPWAGRHVDEPAAPVVDVDDLDAVPDQHDVVVPRCWGRLGVGHRRAVEHGGAELVANGNALCLAHRRWVEDEPEQARTLGGETPWWLVARSGDPEWERLGQADWKATIRSTAWATAASPAANERRT